jgi:acyl-lipid omega-6 desaturase (Delta-12 desaturase)
MTATATATAPSPPAGADPVRERPFWKDGLDPYARPVLWRSLLDLGTSVVPYLALSVLMYLSLDVSYWLTLAIAVPTAGFLVRTFIVFHDCTHGSFMPSKRANEWVGGLCGLLVFAPFQRWRHQHAMHHATSGDLERRGDGDVPTLTVDEYNALGWRGKLGYRLFRNPLVMFTIGPIYSMMIAPRYISHSARPRLRRSVLRTNLALLVMIGGLCWLIGWQAYLLIQAPTILLAGTTGVWLFYVQHQFEDAYWEAADGWSYADAALRGSSYLRLPKVLQFFTGNIGLHHVHHLSAKIPNYNLQAAHDENPVFHDVPVLTLRDCLRCTRLKLIDEGSGRLVTFAEARAAMRAAPAAVIG